MDMEELLQLVYDRHKQLGINNKETKKKRQEKKGEIDKRIREELTTIKENRYIIYLTDLDTSQEYDYVIYLTS